MPVRHEIPVTEEMNLVAVHHEADSTEWMVFCHGLRSDKTGSYEGRCRRAVRAGYNAVRFDFRGCGESDGEFADGTLGARIEDLEAVLEHFDPESLVLFGSSFGGKVAFHAAVGDDRVRAIVARAPVTYGPDRATERENDGGEGATPRGGDSGSGSTETGASPFYADFGAYDFRTVERKLDCPVAIFHGEDDGSVPIERSFTAVANLPVDALVQKYESEGHRFTRGAEDRLRQQAFDWLETT